MALLVATGVMILCRDDVLIEVSLSRLRRSRQDVKVATGALLRPRNFRSRQKSVVSRLDFMECCRDRVLAKTKRSHVATKCFCVTTELAVMERLYVAT